MKNLNLKAIREFSKLGERAIEFYFNSCSLPKLQKMSIQFDELLRQTNDIYSYVHNSIGIWDKTPEYYNILSTRYFYPLRQIAICCDKVLTQKLFNELKTDWNC